MSNVTTLLDLLQVAPDRGTAVILPEAGIRVSYGSLREQVLAMAEGLAAAGIERGNRVAIVLPNGLPSIVCFLAASIAGTAAPLNSGYREEEFSFYLDDTAARVLLCPPEGAEEARKAAAGKVPIYAVDMDDKGFVRLAGTPGGNQARNGHNVAPPQPDDIALVLHTSGSTGRPKRVPLRHTNLAASAHNIVKTYGLSSNDVSLCAMPLFHVHGLVASTISTLLSGGAVVAPGKFAPLSLDRKSVV